MKVQNNKERYRQIQKVRFEQGLLKHDPVIWATVREQGKTVLLTFRVSAYKKVFERYNGRMRIVRPESYEEYSKYIVDRFGHDVPLPYDDYYWVSSYDDNYSGPQWVDEDGDDDYDDDGDDLLFWE